MALAFSNLLILHPGQGEMARISITLDASYALGGIALTPTQLGHNNLVYFGDVHVRTSTGTHSPAQGVLDCTTQIAPKLKLVGESNLAELGAGAGSGAVVDVTSWGA